MELQWNTPTSRDTVAHIFFPRGFPLVFVQFSFQGPTTIQLHFIITLIAYHVGSFLGHPTKWCSSHMPLGTAVFNWPNFGFIIKGCGKYVSSLLLVSVLVFYRLFELMVTVLIYCWLSLSVCSSWVSWGLTFIVVSIFESVLFQLLCPEMSIDVKIVAVVNWGSEHTCVILCWICSSVITLEDCVEVNCYLACDASVSLISHT